MYAGEKASRLTGEKYIMDSAAGIHWRCFLFLKKFLILGILIVKEAIL